jgi:hypothetical protein
VVGRVSLVLLLVLRAAASAAAPPVTVSASATVGERTLVTVEVRNTGAQPVTAVAPEVVYRGLEVRADRAADLAPGGQETWTFTLPPPDQPGTVPAAIQVRYHAGSQARSVPTVAAVSTPGLLPGEEVAATLTASAATGFAQAQLVLENPTAAAIHGRVVVLLPAGLETEPVSQAADVPPHGRRSLTLVLQTGASAPPSPAPVVVLFEYGRDGRRHLAVASASVTIGGGTAVRPLSVGIAALATALALLALAWHRASRRHRGPNPEHSHP